ncbi:MAG: type VI secretion system baseplate subunit TssE, partial [Isosphaeraceae bacterium]
HSSMSSSEDQVALRQLVESAIARFEPRLTQVNVSMVEGKQFDRTLRFRIDGILEVEPTPEAVSFDSVLQLLTKTFTLEGE